MSWFKASKVIIGTGSSRFPSSRGSVGNFLLNKLADKVGAKWTEENGAYWAAVEDLLLLKPQMYLPEDEEQRVFYKIHQHFLWKFQPNQLTVIIPDANQLLGSYAVSRSGDTRDNTTLSVVEDLMQSENFGRFVVGVNRATEEEMFLTPLNPFSFPEEFHSTIFMRNKFPPKDWNYLNNFALDHLLSALLEAVHGKNEERTKKMGVNVL
eukprot:TRINITY_DN1731_c0_g1_i1.p1 TRINITY_DN1731_c0_g1~~TRINITY_DN1731_c0_g1_i1.p1  ORF type:complete len:209 (+),score=63.77 TRINITY_DN1731_c0_g1_i1:54-680(+)